MRKKLIRYFIILIIGLFSNCAFGQNDTFNQKAQPLSILVDSVYKYYKQKKIIQLRIQVLKQDSINYIFQQFDFPLSSGITNNVSFYVEKKVCGLFYILENESGNFLFQDIYSYPMENWNWRFFNKKTKRIRKEKVTMAEYNKLVLEENISRKFLLKRRVEHIETFLELTDYLEKGKYSVFLFYGHCPCQNSKDFYWYSISNKINIDVIR